MSASHRQEPAVALEEQGNAAWKQARYAEAQQQYERALEIREREHGPEHPEVARLLSALGELLQTQEQYSEAEERYRRALAIRERAFGREHPDTIESIGNLAGIFDEKNEPELAEPLYREALEKSEQLHGPEHPLTALAASKLARFYRVIGEYDQAEALYQRAAGIFERHNDADFAAHHATTLNNFAYLKLVAGRPLDAEPLLRRAIVISTRASRFDHPNTATSLKNLARAYSEQGELTLAHALCQRALTVLTQKLGATHTTTVAVQQQWDALQQAVSRAG